MDAVKRNRILVFDEAAAETVTHEHSIADENVSLSGKPILFAQDWREQHSKADYLMIR